jgi:hypothetical protein
MYEDSSKGIYRQDYLQGVESFINFIIYKLNNISADEIRCLYVKYKNKKFHHKDMSTVNLGLFFVLLFFYILLPYSINFFLFK